MALLTTNWQPMDPAGALAAYTSGVKLGQADNAAAMQAQQQAQAMIERAQQQKEIEARSQANYALQLLQDQRAEHAQQLKDKYDALREQRESAAVIESRRRYEAENAPLGNIFGAGGAGATPGVPTGRAVPAGVDLFNAGNAANPAEGLLRLDATGYHPYDVQSDAERKMEGAPVDAKGNPIHTLESFQRGESPYVTVAVPQGSDLFGKILSSPQAPGVVFKADDHFGSLDGKKIQGPRIDIATDTRDMASKLTGPMTFTLGGSVAPPSATKPLVPDAPAVAGANAGETYTPDGNGGYFVNNPVELRPATPGATPGAAPDAASALLAAQKEQQFRAAVALMPRKLGLQAYKEHIVDQARTSASESRPVVRNFQDGTTQEFDPQTGTWKVLATKPDSTNPIVRNMADGTTQEFDPQTRTWSVLATKPVKDTSEEDTRKREDQTMQKINVERGRMKDASAEMSKLTKQGKEPSWPWQEGGKYFKLDDEGNKVETTLAGYNAAFEKAKATDWADLNDQRAKHQARIAELGKQLDSLRTPAPAAEPAPEPPPAPNDGKPKIITHEIAAQIMAEVGGDKAKARALAKQRGFTL